MESTAYIGQHYWLHQKPHGYTKRRSVLFTDDLNEYPLAPASIEFAVEYLLPGAEVEFAPCYRHYYFAAHDLAFQVGVGIILTGVVMAVTAYRGVRGEVFEPCGVIVMQSSLIIVNENGGGDVHCVYKNQSLSNAAFPQALLHLWRDVYEGQASWSIEPQLFSIAFQAGSSLIRGYTNFKVESGLPQINNY